MPIPDYQTLMLPLLRLAAGGVTKAPEAEARLSYGERKTFHGALYLNVPLSDKIAFNVSAQREFKRRATDRSPALS